MNTNIFNYKNAGCIVALLLIVILSQTKFLIFLTNTSLGRSVLIFLLLVISYINQILGIVFVLLLIIIFNGNTNNLYLEGFTDTTIPASSNDSKKSLIKTTSTTTTVTSKSPITGQSPSVSTPANVPANEDIQTNLTPNTTAQEGFDIIGKERNIQKGRNSNSIPVNDFMRESADVLPYDNSDFSESFTLFK